MKNKRKYLTDANTVSDSRYSHWDQLRKGLKQIHIGGDVWLIGKIYLHQFAHYVIVKLHYKRWLYKTTQHILMAT